MCTIHKIAVYGTNKIVRYVNNNMMAYKFSHTVNPLKRGTNSMTPSPHTCVIGVYQDVFIVESFFVLWESCRNDPPNCLAIEIGGACEWGCSVPPLSNQPPCDRGNNSHLRTNLKS